MIELLQIFVDNIAPILIIALVGYGIGLRFSLDPRPVGRILFYVLSPALVLQSVSTSEISGSEIIQIGLVMLAFVGIMASAAYLIMRWRGASQMERAAVMLGATCPNNGNFGLPLVSFAFGPEVFARAVIVFITITFLNYTSGIFIASSGKKSARQAVRNILYVPAIYAALGGLLLNFGDIVLPPVIARPILLLSQGTIPMMLILLGLQLARSAEVRQVKTVSVGVGLRLLLSPVVAAALALAIGLDTPASVAVIMQASMPVAVVTIIMASEFELDRQLSLGMIFGSTLFSPLTLSVLILLLRRWAGTA